MPNKFMKKIAALFALSTMFLTSCSDFKTPLEGYISDKEVTEIVNKFKDGASEFNRYSVNGNFNYFAYDENRMPSTVNYVGILLDAPEYYIKDKIDDNIPLKEQPKANSYYLRLPMRITPTSWTSNVKDEDGRSSSTKYQLESKVYRPEGLDSVYYYNRDDGGFILRTFGVNKALIIEYPSGITSGGKWNIEAEYNADGYLVREYFATVNASEDNKSECCYGEATYSFSHVNED